MPNKWGESHGIDAYYCHINDNNTSFVVHDFIKHRQKRIHLLINEAAAKDPQGRFGVRPDFQRVMEENESRNIPRSNQVIMNLHKIAGEHRGQPVIICGSGPGLVDSSRNIVELKKKYNAVVIAINEAIGCPEVGKAVDYWLCIDRNSMPIWLKGPAKERTDFKVVAAVSTNYHLCQVIPDDRIVWCWTDYTIGDAARLITQCGMLESGLTTAFAALDLAHIIGAGRVILIGIEWSWIGKEGDVQHYFDQKISETCYKNKYKEEGGHMLMRSCYGPMELTHGRMMRECAIFMGGCQVLLRNGIPVVNAAGRGMLELPIHVATLNEAIGVPNEALRDAFSKVGINISIDQDFPSSPISDLPTPPEGQSDSCPESLPPPVVETVVPAPPVLQT